MRDFAKEKENGQFYLIIFTLLAVYGSDIGKKMLPKKLIKRKKIYAAHIFTK